MGHDTCTRCRTEASVRAAFVTSIRFRLDAGIRIYADIRTAGLNAHTSRGTASNINLALPAQGSSDTEATLLSKRGDRSKSNDERQNID
jgi:hypothetical protein